MVSKARQQRYHFHVRQRQRLPDETHSEDIVASIKAQLGVVVRKQSHRVTLWGIFTSGDFYIFPFDKNTQQVVTVLPRASEYYAYLKWAFFKEPQLDPPNWCEDCGRVLEPCECVACKCCTSYIHKGCVDEHYEKCVKVNWQRVISPGKPLVC
jgi:hypothetical protein